MSAFLRGSNVSPLRGFTDFASAAVAPCETFRKISENFFSAGVTSLFCGTGDAHCPHFCRAVSGRKSRRFASYQLEARSRQGDAASSLHLGDQRTTAVAFHHNAGFYADRSEDPVQLR